MVNVTASGAMKQFLSFSGVQALKMDNFEIFIAFGENISSVCTPLLHHGYENYSVLP